VAAVSNTLRPKMLPGRLWTDGKGRSALYRQVHYRQGELGSIGFLARWRRQGRVPLSLASVLRPAQDALDHVEYWLSYGTDHATRDLSARVLVGHPYRFTDAMREALVVASGQFDLIWSATPPKRGSPSTDALLSWYDELTWLVIVQPAASVVRPEPQECKIRYGRAERRPLAIGETLSAVEKPSKRAKRDRGTASRPPKISVYEAISNPKEALERLRKWQKLRAELLQLDEEIAEADRRLQALEEGTDDVEETVDVTDDE
jgi:hypothetical protein